MDGDGAKQKLLAHGDAPDWSPDGTQIAYARGGQIWVMNANGSENTQVTHSETRKNGPSWSPDGRQMVFIIAPTRATHGPRRPKLGVMKADGTGSSQLTASPNRRNADDPTWSPDGTKILFTTGRRELPELWVMDADGSYEVPLFPLDPYPFPGRASWQPVARGH